MTVAILDYEEATVHTLRVLKGTDFCETRIALRSLY
jgi:hypothetical protein